MITWQRQISAYAILEAREMKENKKIIDISKLKKFKSKPKTTLENEEITEPTRGKAGFYHTLNKEKTTWVVCVLYDAEGTFKYADIYKNYKAAKKNFDGYIAGERKIDMTIG